MSDSQLPLSPSRGNWLTRAWWGPYVVGIGIGVLSWLAFAVAKQPIGMSTAVSEVAGACAIPVAGSDAVYSNAYWAKHKPAWNYGTVFLVGTFLGALLSVLLSRSFRVETVPAVWEERFGRAKGPRLFVAFVGGMLALYGARMAGGCTSGHGISGTLQLALSSWTFFIVMFAAGIVTAAVLFRPRRTPSAVGALSQTPQVAH